ncbi:hypothetical protein DRQ53_14115 [bacterium]|nr:MAG: hypothetical protein DRQ53_14115 [bacterium]
MKRQSCNRNGCPAQATHRVIHPQYKDLPDKDGTYPFAVCLEHAVWYEKNLYGVQIIKPLATYS